MVRPREQWRHLALFISILLLFVISPAVTVFRHGALILNVIAAIGLIAGSYAVSERKYFLAIALVLSGISIVATWLLLIIQRPWMAVLSHGCLIVLVAFFAIVILGYVLRSGRVTTDRIFAAICVYLLIGYAWTLPTFWWKNCSPLLSSLCPMLPLTTMGHAFCKCGTSVLSL